MNGQTITFEGQIASGHYLQYVPGEKAVVRNPRGEVVSEMKVKGVIPEIKTGKNSIKYRAKSSSRSLPSIVTWQLVGEKVK